MNQDRASTITNSQLKEGYKQTEVGIIPEDWQVKRLKYISPSQSVGLVINPFVLVPFNIDTNVILHLHVTSLENV